MHLKKNKAKGVAVNGFRSKKASELFRNRQCDLLFTEDLNIIRTDPAERNVSSTWNSAS